ncbi:hypothetical protein [Fontibacillus sp. BL9]
MSTGTTGALKRRSQGLSIIKPDEGTTVSFIVQDKPLREDGE